MIGQSQALLLSGGGERPSLRPSPTNVPPPQPQPQPQCRIRGYPQVPLKEVDVDPELYMHRRNNMPEVLGKFRRYRVCGHDWFFSHDSWAWYIPTFLTLWVVVGNLAVAWPIISWLTYVIVLTLVTTGFISSFLVTCTDPGIYPRLKPGEADPLAAYEDLVLCRVCQIRRPPRTAHCYQCNVCVLNHDHHCGVIGGCVGQRSLRWFTLFLVCQSSACCIGVYWLLYFMIVTVFQIEENSQQAARGATATVSTTELPSLVKGVLHHPFPARRNRQPPMDPDIVGARHIGAVFMLLIDFVIITLVGGLGVVYVYLTVSSTTRRESQKRETSFRICLQPGRMLANIRETACPPSTLLKDGTDSDVVDVAVEQITEMDQLV